MTAVILPASFASQSDTPCVVEQLAISGARVCLIAAAHYPASGTVRVAALKPSRYYRLGGAADGFCRTTADGSATIPLTIARSALLLLAPVL